MLFSVFLICLIVNGGKTELEGDCFVEGVTAGHWQTAYNNVPVNDNESIIFKKFTTINVTDVTMSGDEYIQYFDIKLEKNDLTIAPSQEFKNFEKNEKNQEKPMMIIKLVFTCNSGKASLSFYQPINDLNTNNPLFSQTSYSYKLPMPLPGDFNLQCLTDVPIEACDSDITNMKLNFAVNPPEDFSITSSGTTDNLNKCHNAFIKTKKPLTLNQTTSYELIVTDIGNPTKSSKVTMQIEINEQTAVPSNPQFNFAYYTATYDDTNQQHVVKIDTAITLEKKDSSASVTLLGEHKDNFDIATNGNTVTLTLTKNLADEVISENVVVLLTLEAIVPNAEGPGRTALVIYMPKKECPTTTTSIPTTACPTTETPTECPICTTEATTILTCPPCTTETPILTTACPTTKTPTECPICTTEATTILTCPPCTTETPILTTVYPTTKNPTECPICTTESTTILSCPPCTNETLTFPTTECPVCSTEPTTILTCPTGTTETPPCPTIEPLTECPVCTTEVTTSLTFPNSTTKKPTHPTAETLTDCPVCSTEPTILTCTPCTAETSKCPVYTTESTSYSVSDTTKHPLNLTTPFSTSCPTTECPPCTTLSSTSLSVTTLNSTVSTTTFFNSECPPCTTLSTECTVTNCPPCTTIPITTELLSSISTSPPCLTTSVTPVESRVVFLQDIYTFDTVSEDKVTVGAVKAVAIPEEEIEYSIKKDGENLTPSQLTINKNSGILTLNEKLDLGVYTVLAHAKGVNSGAENTTHVKINVYIETETADVLIVETIDENVKSTIPLPCPNGQATCTYQLMNQYPETSQALFKYQNGSLITEAISLQLKEIKDFINPQFALNLKLTNTESTQIFAPNQSVKDEDIWHWLYLPNSIPRDSNTLLVSVIVNDINDHYPVFDVGSNLTVGYPIKTLLNVLSPSYLVQVHATDLDKGLYADIRYTTTDKDFIVHPKTGVIYPGENAFNNNINKQFSVVATDMDGAADGKSTSLDINVKLLTQQHLTYLTIENKLLEDLDDVLKELSIKTNLQINYLTAAIVRKEQSDSSNEVLRKLRNTKDNDDYAIKLIIYALDGNNELVQTETLQETLEDVEDVGDLSTTNWNSTCSYESNVEVINLTGYIVGIAVLASLLVIFMITVGVLYYIKIYKKRTPEPYNVMAEEDSGSIKSENPQSDDEVDLTKRRPTGFVFNPPPVEEDDESITGDKKYESIPSRERAVDGASLSYNNTIEIEKDKNTYNNDLKLQITDDNVDYKNIQDSRKSPNSLDYENPSKKSVSFKPIVQKINIVVDNDKQDDDDVDVHL